MIIRQRKTAAEYSVFDNPNASIFHCVTETNIGNTHTVKNACMTFQINYAGNKAVFLFVSALLAYEIIEFLRYSWIDFVSENQDNCYPMQRLLFLLTV